MLHMNERRSLCGVHPCDSSQLVGRCAGWVAANTRSKIYWWLAFTDHPSDHNIIWPLHFHWMNFSTRNRGLQLLVPSWHCFPLSLWRISRPSPTIKVTKHYIVNIVLSKLLGKNPGRPLSTPQPIKPLKRHLQRPLLYWKTTETADFCRTCFQLMITEVTTSKYATILYT